MIELKRDALVFGFPEVHTDARCRIDFQRILRIPDDNRDYLRTKKIKMGHLLKRV